MGRLTPNEHNRYAEEMSSKGGNCWIRLGLFNFYNRHHPMNSEMGKKECISRAKMYLQAGRKLREGEINKLKKQHQTNEKIIRSFKAAIRNDQMFGDVFV